MGNSCSWFVVRGSWFVVLLIIIAGCGGPAAPKKVLYPNTVTPEIQAKFNQVEEQYRRRNYEYAFSGYDYFIQTFPYNKLTDEAYYKQGKIFFLNKRYEDAYSKFTELARQTPSPVYRAKALHMASYCSYMQENNKLAITDLKKVQPSILPAKMRVQYYSLIIYATKQSQTDLDFGNEAKLYLLNLYEEYAGQNLKTLHGANIVRYSDVLLLVEAWVDMPMGFKNISEWMKRFPDSPGKAYVDYKIGKIYYEEGNRKKARRSFTRFVQKYPKNQYASSAQKILTELGGSLVEVVLKKANYKVGVLLPLTGKYQSYARSVLDGVRCGVGEDGLCGDYSGVQLVVRDPGFTPGSVRLAIDDLANQSVVAIIGPLSGNVATDAGVAATVHKIPIFPITQKAGLMRLGDYIFQVGMQPKQQIQALVKSAADRGFRSFGIFFPNSNYGKTMAELFTDEVKSHGGRITAYAEYKRHSSDLYAEARKLKKSIGRVGKPNAGIGFDALFIPDSYQRINSIVGALEFNGIKGVPLLGTNAWNDPNLTLAIAHKFPGSFFIDLYDGASKSKQVKDFKDKFIRGFGRNPRVLEAYGFDIMMMILKAASSHGPHKIQSTLEKQFGFEGVTGIRGFTVGEGAVVESAVLKIKSTGVRE